MPFTDLVTIVDGRPTLGPRVHPLPDLLTLEPEAVLAAFRRSQAEDFRAVLDDIAADGSPLARLFHEMRSLVPADSPFAALPVFEPRGLHRLFEELHEHVMSHPVWLHPFFLRFFRAEFDQRQLGLFARHYFNQIKNTRQCVAIAIGRFHGLMGLPYGVLNERVSEMTQIVLAQLVADEYGVGARPLEDYPSLAAMFGSHTHIAMYRQLFDGLGIPFAEQDVAMLPGVADNVLTQRLVAGHPDFTPLEALASVGLGMEWGVPEFFSLLLGGVLRFAGRQGLELEPRHVEVLTAHVRYDVLHALAVMLATALHLRSAADLQAVKNATNILMAGRYAMMSSLWQHVFEEPCPAPGPSAFDERHRVGEERIRRLLVEARRAVPEGLVVDQAAWRDGAETPWG